jgi:hypothetical protein
VLLVTVDIEFGFEPDNEGVSTVALHFAELYRRHVPCDDFHHSRFLRSRILESYFAHKSQRSQEPLNLYASEEFVDCRPLTPSMATHLARPSWAMRKVVRWALDQIGFYSFKFESR